VKDAVTRLLQPRGTGGQLFDSPRNRRYWKANLLMLRSEGSDSKWKLRAGRGSLPILCFLILVALIAPAAAQDFTLTTSPLSPDAVAPGGVSSTNVSLVAGSGFAGPVTLACTVTPTVQITSTSFPVCSVSPGSLSGSGGASATITTSGTTPQIGYTIVVTGTDGSGSVSSQAQTLTVLAVTPQFTITVQSALAPSSVVAGKGAAGTVSVNPLAGYTTGTSGYITLFCSSITPLVTIAPICTFTYPTGQPGVQVTGNTPVTSIITVTTYGPITTGVAVQPRNFYALWLPVPMFGIVCLGAAIGGKRSRKAWGLLGLFILSGALLLLPACANTTNTPSTSTPNGTTPANTYTFTILGVDTNGVVSSNTGSTSSGPTVSLTVTAPK
jgi:hypothetical protein